MFPLVISCFLHRNVQSNGPIDGHPGALAAADRSNHNIVSFAGAGARRPRMKSGFAMMHAMNSPALDKKSERYSAASVGSA